MATESRLDGEWEGWDGDTVLTLMNGQVWRQTEYYYEYRYAYMPRVWITNDRKALVEGHRRAVRVEQLA